MELYSFSIKSWSNPHVYNDTQAVCDDGGFGRTNGQHVQFIISLLLTAKQMSKARRVSFFKNKLVLYIGEDHDPGFYF